MDSLTRSAPHLPMTRIFAFLGMFLALYAVAATVAELRVGRNGTESAMQKLNAVRGTEVDWIVLGASHALPLAYGGIPERLEAETGQSMMVLAEVGAGPLYSDFVLQQALSDLRPKRLLYLADSFGFRSRVWNEERIADRKLLRTTPLRISTLETMVDFALSHNVAGSAALDYATGFSKLNPPDRFPTDDWRGAENFERTFRPSRHATQSRIKYLYPDPTEDAALERYLDVLEDMVTKARAAGLSVTIVKPPVPEAFRNAMPDEATFDAALRTRLAKLDVPLNDLSAAIDDPKLYFDTDHLNRDGVDLLYEHHLKALLAAEQ